MTTMFQSEDPTMHVGMVGAEIWLDAVERIRDGVVPTDDVDQLAFWEAAGILASGQLDPLWGRAITVEHSADRGIEILSRYGDVVFSATVLVDGDTATCVTSRATVAANAEGVEEVDALHPMVEVAITPSSRVWELIRRVMPPLDELRHEPRPTRESEAKRVTLEGVVIPEVMKATPESFATHLLEIPNLPPAILDATDPRASVFTYTIISDDRGTRTYSKTWALGRKLYLIDADTGSIWEVPPGDLGFALVQGLAS